MPSCAASRWRRSPTSPGPAPRWRSRRSTPSGQARPENLLVTRELGSLAGLLKCPADDGKLVPVALAGKASALLGKPTLPVSGDKAHPARRGALATTNPKARLVRCRQRTDRELLHAGGRRRLARAGPAAWLDGAVRRAGDRDAAIAAVRCRAVPAEFPSARSGRCDDGTPIGWLVATATVVWRRCGLPPRAFERTADST